MKMPSFFTRLTASRTAGILCGCVLTGVLTGVVIAMITIRHEMPTYRAWKQLFIERPQDLAAGTPDAEWLESCAATLRSRESLAAAAHHSGMDKRKGISPAACGEILPGLVNVRVANAVQSPQDGSRKVIYMSSRGESAKVSAALLAGLAGILEEQFKELNAQYEASQPTRKQWLALVAQLPVLRKEISTREQEVRDAINGINGRKVNIGAEELLRITPPLIARESHEALKAAIGKMDQVRQQAASLQPRAGYHLQSMEGATPAEGATQWEPYAWPRALAGGAAGLILGIALLLRKQRTSGSPVQGLPGMTPVEY